MARDKKKQTIFEGALAQLSSFLLKLFDGTFVDTTTFVDQVSGSGGFSGIHMADDYER